MGKGERRLWGCAVVTLSAALALPWWSVTCDDGCATGETGLVDVGVLTSWRGWCVAVLLVAAVVALAANHRAAALPVEMAALIMVSMFVIRPRYSTAAPYYF